MSRSIESSLQALLAVSQACGSDFNFLAEPNIPGGPIDPTLWGVTFPLGLWTSFGHSQTTRESGSVGSVEGKDNSYLLRLLMSQYQSAVGRVASQADELHFYDALKDAIVPDNGNPCFSGVLWATIQREKPDFVTFAGISYIGCFVIVTLNERY